MARKPRIHIHRQSADDCNSGELWTLLKARGIMLIMSFLVEAHCELYIVLQFSFRLAYSDGAQRSISARQTTAVSAAIVIVKMSRGMKDTDFEKVLLRPWHDDAPAGSPNYWLEVTWNHTAEQNHVSLRANNIQCMAPAIAHPGQSFCSF